MQKQFFRQSHSYLGSYFSHISKSVNGSSKWQLSAVYLLIFALTSNVYSQTLLSAFNFGGEQQNSGYSVATDANGNALVTGYFEGTADFDPGSGTFNLTSNGNFDIFIAKYDPAGQLIFAFSIGGAVNDWGNGIAVDAAGNVVVTGKFSGTVDFDPGPGIANLTSNNGVGAYDDIFVAKYDPMGHLIFAFNIGGPYNDEAYDVATDALGNVLVTGYFQGNVDFDPGPGVTNLTTIADLSSNQFDPDIFVAKYDPSGNLVFAFNISDGLTQLWGEAISDAGIGITTDTAGNVLVTGFFQGTADFDPGPGATNLSSDRSPDIFVAKYDSMGFLLFAFNIGSDVSSGGYGRTIATDAANNIVVAGAFYGTNLDFEPGPGVTNLSAADSYDTFLAKYDSDGRLLFAFKLDGSSTYPYQESIEGIATDPAGNIFTTGYFDNTVDFDPGAGTAVLTTNGGKDVFLAKYDKDGNLMYVFNVGGKGVGYDDSGRDIATDSSGNIVITGTLGYSKGEGVDFDPDAGVTNLVIPHLFDIFLARYADDMPLLDSDSDLVPDVSDNCTLVSNLNQRDTDGDGYGNACDADLDNSGGVVNFADLALFKTAFGTNNSDADFDGGGGVVGFADLAIFKQLFGKPPGPSCCGMLSP